MPSIHAEVLEIQATYRSWEELEERLLEWYGLDNSLCLPNRELMEWVEQGKANINTSPGIREAICAVVGVGPDRARHEQSHSFYHVG